LTGIRNYLIRLIVFALETFDGMMLTAVDVLSGDLASWSAIVGFANSVIYPFALLIIGICLLIEISLVASKVDIIKWEHGLKLCVKMALSVAALSIAPLFLEAMYAQAAAWIADAAAFGGSSAFGDMIANEIEALISNMTGMWNTIFLFLSTFVLLLAIQICGLLIAVIAFARMFELYVYLAVSPIPVAFFPLGDGTGGGFSRITAKFLRSFAAVCLQGFLMLICLRVFGFIMTDVIIDSIAAAAGADAFVQVNQLMYAMLLGCIVLVMSVVKSGGWAKSILDAN
jgi:hypothetical protein